MISNQSSMLELKRGFGESATPKLWKYQLYPRSRAIKPWYKAHIVTFVTKSCNVSYIHCYKQCSIVIRACCISALNDCKVSLLI